MEKKTITLVTQMFWVSFFRKYLEDALTHWTSQTNTVIVEIQRKKIITSGTPKKFPLL